jgi:hypothetical protein
MKRLFYWIFLLFILSCSKKDPCDGVEKIQITGYKNLDESQKQLMPYQGNETLLFISNKGDTALLRGTGNLQEYRRLKLSGSGFYCGEEHYDSYQFLAAEYKGDNPKFNQLIITIFKDLWSDPLLRFNCNNDNSHQNIFDGSSIAALNDPRFFPFKFFYKGDSVITTKITLFENNTSLNGSYLVYQPFKGIIGYQLDSNTTFTLN